MKKLFLALVVSACVFAAHAQTASDLFILFPANSADLRAVGAQQAVANSQVFSKVAQMLVEDPQLRILIDGHANPVIKTTAEELEALRPLALRRAQAAADFLVAYFQVDRHRLIVSTAGGGFPGTGETAATNRRVSFFSVRPR